MGAHSSGRYACPRAKLVTPGGEAREDETRSGVMMRECAANKAIDTRVPTHNMQDAPSRRNRWETQKPEDICRAEVCAHSANRHKLGSHFFFRGWIRGSV